MLNWYREKNKELLISKDHFVPLIIRRTHRMVGAFCYGNEVYHHVRRSEKL